MTRIYLDNNATTALDPRVFKAMLADLSGPPANPSSTHSFGKQAKHLLTKAREQVAAFFSVSPKEVIFTSGGTESINQFLRGLPPKGHIITSTIEHAATHRTLQALESQGLKVTYLPVGLWGAPLPEHVASAIRPDTQAIALSAANSETGVKIDLEAIASIAQNQGIPFLLDAVCFIGKEPFTNHPGISAIAVSGHKFHAPKGIGALILRAPCKIAPLATGGAQEHMHRAGTENLSGILGLAEALQILATEQTPITEHLNDLRLRLEHGLKAKLPFIEIHGEGPRISNTSSIAFAGIDGETLLIHLDMAGIAVSHGSACASGAQEPSRVLTQMGISHKLAASSLRFSVGRMNTREEIDLAIDTIAKILYRK